jgi:hypothetical protein
LHTAVAGNFKCGGVVIGAQNEINGEQPIDEQVRDSWKEKRQAK